MSANTPQAISAGEQTAFQITPEDNVATALCALQPGPVRINGDAPVPEAVAAEAIPVGHKLALKAIASGEAIIKYGMTIGRTTKAIPRGGWVHTHCVSSTYDERSSHLDPVTGAPQDISYE